MNEFCENQYEDDFDENDLDYDENEDISIYDNYDD